MRQKVAAVVIAAGLSMLSVASLPSGAGASIARDKTTIDLTGIVLTCPAEEVVFSGLAELVEVGVTSPSGVISTHLLLNLNGLSARGETSNQLFRVVGVTATGFSAPSSAAGGATTSRFVQTWLLVPLAGGTPLSFHELLTLVYNANGDLVSLASEGPADCD